MAGQLPNPRPVSTEDRDELLIPLVSGVQELLFAPTTPFNDRPGFVAGPVPDTGLGRAVQGVTRLNCRLWASRDKTNYSQRVNQYNGEVCGPYLEGLGENPDPGSVQPEYSGGQCTGVRYLFSFTGKVPNNAPVTFSAIERGPTRMSRALNPGDVCGEFDPPGLTYKRWTLIGLDNQQGVWAGCGATLTVNSVTPIDPEPGNCGNQAPLVQPPATVSPVTPIAPTFDINLPGVGPITINVDLDDRGRPVICAPEVETCITIPVEIGIGIGGDGGEGEPGGGGNGPAPGDDGEPGVGQPAGPGQDAEGEAPPGSVLVGLKMNMTTIPEGSNQYMPGAYRGAAFIYMGGNAGLDQDFGGSTLANGQFVYAEKDNLTKWRVRANNEFEFNVVPYYRSAT